MSIDYSSNFIFGQEQTAFLSSKSASRQDRSVTVATGLFILFIPFAGSNQADDTTIRINGYTPGVTPFISNVSLTAGDTTVLKEIQFKIVPKPGSVTRPLSATYANYYLIDRGFENQQTGDITLPVYGLYDGYANTVTLTYSFMDGSSKQANITITTASFNDPCGYKNPTFLQHRTSASLSYDYFMGGSALLVSRVVPILLASLIMAPIFLMALNCIESSSMGLSL